MTEFRSHPLDAAAHKLAAFDSGVAQLDDWLKSHAASAEARRTSRTWVWTEADERVIGYYTLAANKVAREQLPTTVARGGPAEVPAILIGKLALDQSFAGRGLGSLLLADALQRVVGATSTVGARVVVVDAISESAATFYEHHGFRRAPDSLVLVRKLVDVEAAWSVAQR